MTTVNLQTLLCIQLLLFICTVVRIAATLYFM